ncbi:MAG: site-specific integrase [Christensenellaceae bacterium]|jgi:site-specific recombinase XerD|nr:site-specific integrase [Christensenellaceae bacterium]
MKELSITQLIEACMSFFREHNYSEERIREYQCRWNNGIKPFMRDKGLRFYNVSIGLEYRNTYLTENPQENPTRDKIRAIDVLDDMLMFETISKRRTIPTVYPLDGIIGKEMEKFLLHLQSQRRSKSTLQRHRLHLSGFLMSLTTNRIGNISMISEQNIVCYISSRRTDLHNCISTLRGLFRFWHTKNIVDRDYQELFSTIPIPKKEKIPSYYNKDEIVRIEDSVSRANPLGKRNYAILLLATRLGLRASDIATLKFSDINWDTSMITLVMKKTGKIIELPLLPEVGNAIIDYLRNGRPKSESQQIFLYAVAPYKKIASFGVSSAISQIIQHSSVDAGNRHHGSHSMRHSLAACMLTNGETIPTISEVLGHKKTQTTLTYLKIDLKSLLSCALPVPTVDESFYMQEGGVFYE